MYEIDNFLDIKRENRGVHRKNKNMYKYIKRKQCPDVSVEVSEGEGK